MCTSNSASVHSPTPSIWKVLHALGGDSVDDENRLREGGGIPEVPDPRRPARRRAEMDLALADEFRNGYVPAT